MSARSSSSAAAISKWLIDAVLPGEGMIVQFCEVYVDESGTHAGSPVLCVAGFLFEKERSKILADEWQHQLDKYGIPYFRMSECAHGCGVFKNLKMQDRIDIGTSLIQVIKLHMTRGFAITIADSDYTSLEGWHDKVGQAYSFCLRQCLSYVRRWSKNEFFNGEVAYFFESGHRDQSEANRIVSNIMRDPKNRAEYRYVSHTFADKDKLILLQCADLLAWQWFTDRRHQLEGRPRRKDLAALLRDSNIDRRHWEMGNLEVFDSHLRKQGLRTTAETLTQNRKAFESLIEHVSGSNKLIAPLEDNYTLESFTPEKGKSYFSHKCLRCGEMTPIFEDASKGSLGNPFSGIGRWIIRCRGCNKKINVTTEAVDSIEWG